MTFYKQCLRYKMNTLGQKTFQSEFVEFCEKIFHLLWFYYSVCEPTKSLTKCCHFHTVSFPLNILGITFLFSVGHSLISRSDSSSGILWWQWKWNLTAGYQGRLLPVYINLHIQRPKSHPVCLKNVAKMYQKFWSSFLSPRNCLL